MTNQHVIQPTRKKATKISHDYPPNYDQIKEVFPLTGKEIFAWNGIIYNPGKGRITPELMAHEETHFKQQDGDPQSWWDLYLESPEFMLFQEIEAHQVEYRTYCSTHRNREQRNKFLHIVASRLSSSLYHKFLTYHEARKVIKFGKVPNGLYTRIDAFEAKPK